MPNQLFLQAFATWELIIRTIREGTAYFVQRQPQELGDIGWVIDRKDRTITQMEDTWSTLILPLSESAFAREPLICIIEEDYSYFDARYGFTEATADPEMLRHSQWLSSVYGKPKGTKDSVGIDVKLLLTEQRTFQDSRDSLGLQLSDMLAAILRRASMAGSSSRAGRTLEACWFAIGRPEKGSFSSGRVAISQCLVTLAKSAKPSTLERRT